MVTVLLDEHCWVHHCGLIVDPDETVVQGELVDPYADKDRPLGAVVTYEGHWPPDIRRWRQSYRGPLSGIRPGA